MLSVSEILKVIESGADIPTLAPVIRGLLAIKEDDENALQALKDLVRIDVGLSARMLRAANNDGGYEYTVRDASEAVDSIGLKNARHLALTMNFIDDSHRDADQTIAHQRMQWLWERSICVATAAEAFAVKMGVNNANVFRSIGMLLDVGVFFLLYNFPNDYGPVIDRWQSEGGNLIDIENEVLGVDHATVGKQMARKWNFGTQVEDAIFHHSDLEEVADNSKELTCFRLANLAAAVLFENRHTTGFERANRLAETSFGWERSHFTDVLQRITLIADQAAMKVSLQTGPAVPYVDLLRSVNSELGKATLTYEQMVRELEIAMNKAELLAKKLEEANQKLREAANYDPLTRIHNRRFFEEFLNWNFNRAKRYNTTLGCMMLDIDHFKNVNDTYGHLTGDRVLQGVAEILKSNLRNTDIVARYGGEEFVVLLPETKIDAILLTAWKLNKAVKSAAFPVPTGDLKITISIGIAAYTMEDMPNIEEPMEIVKVADQNMYTAKETGRDRVWPAGV